MAETAWIARLRWPDVEGHLELVGAREWRAVGGSADPEQPNLLGVKLKLALALSDELEWAYRGPQDGVPGYRLSAEVAKQMGAHLEQAPPPPGDPNVDY